LIAPERWLITGGAGFIGKRLTQALRESGKHVRVLDSFIATTEKDYYQQFDCRKRTEHEIAPHFEGHEVVVGDICNAELVKKVCQGIDFIVHLAANTGVQPSIQSPRLDFVSNCLGTFNCLEAAREHGIKRFVYASSGAVLGDVEPPLNEDMKALPLSPYGASKAAGEGYCSAYYESFDLETVVLRFSNVYGPMSLHKMSLVPKFIKKVVTSDLLEIYGGGNQTRDFIYVDDIVSAIVLSATKSGIAGEVFQIASNVETSVNQLCSMLFPLLEERAYAIPDLHMAKALKGDSARNFSQTKKARDLLGWSSQVPLEQGLARTVNWFLDALE